jgi:SAM-dependent methyltransferase
VTDAELGAALRRAGLVPRALSAAWGTTALPALARPLRPLPATPATAALRLLVAGAAVGRRDAEVALGAAVVAALGARGMLQSVGTAAPGSPLPSSQASTARSPGAVPLRARVRVIPVGPSLLVCDHASWPDDSTYHLLGCLPPARVGAWLDVGTGCGTLPLARPAAAARIVAAEVDPGALAHARLGVALSGIRHIDVVASDLLAGVEGGGRFDLVTFNLPIPAEAALTRDGDPAFRHAPAGADLLARFVRDVPTRLAPGATVLLHTWLGPAAAAVVDALPGEVVVVRYTPETARRSDETGAGPTFGVVRWRPDAAPTRRALRRLPTADAPHLAWPDLDPDPDPPPPGH